ncbi:MAG: four helix bundle protein [Alphaproteobacteria bacterium]|nr:four helix bundle protein [Alphaproteobacteria bacterium]MCB9795224.1 four helix bundle protein [Alphaproteobacteria bacterium]MCB9797601.1 four helix bundle protein [Alphaproteobacteria bacterium]
MDSEITMRQTPYLPHENLDCYRLAVEVAREVRGLDFPRGDSDLRNQLLRSSASVVLNIAEGVGQDGKTRLNHYRIAQGSAAESCAALDLLPSPKRDTLQNKLRRIHLMLRKLR